jgi:hypothetical protein
MTNKKKLLKKFQANHKTENTVGLSPEERNELHRMVREIEESIEAFGENQLACVEYGFQEISGEKIEIPMFYEVKGTDVMLAPGKIEKEFVREELLSELLDYVLSIEAAFVD